MRFEFVLYCFLKEKKFEKNGSPLFKDFFQQRSLNFKVRICHPFISLIFLPFKEQIIAIARENKGIISSFKLLPYRYYFLQNMLDFLFQKNRMMYYIVQINFCNFCESNFFVYFDFAFLCFSLQHLLSTFFSFPRFCEIF